jgi:hypothetical protein
MSYTPGYENGALAPNQQYETAYSYYTPAENVRHTPSSLRWTQGTDLLNLYKFIVPKGKLPYFELLETFTPTYDTPTRVFLDEPK